MYLPSNYPALAHVSRLHYYRNFSARYRAHYRGNNRAALQHTLPLFLGGIVIAAFFWIDPGLVGNVFIRQLYPWFIPLFFMVGPGLYGSFCTIKERRNKWHVIHYLPIITGYIILIVHLAFFNDQFLSNRTTCT